MSGSCTFKAALNIVKSISDTFVSYQIDLLIVYGTKIRIKGEKFYPTPLRIHKGKMELLARPCLEKKNPLPLLDRDRSMSK